MTRLVAPGAVRWIVSTLEDAGFETWAVGGAVRDALAGSPSGDWDFTTRARPDQVRRTFRRTVPIGVEHGTVGVLDRDGTLYEVTTFRRDVRTTGRHAEVEFAETLDDDLARRDFTINAVAWHPIREVVHDPFEGRRDMELGILRTVGDPDRRFAEDYLRVLRALRFAGTFALDIDGPTWEALVRAVPSLGRLSAERLHEELQKILSGDAKPSRALALYSAAGVMAHLYPEIERQAEVTRGGSDWLTHALETVDRLPPGRPDLRWAALLQGVGEGPRASGDGEGGEGGDEAASLLRAAAVLERLRASKVRVREISEVAALLAHPPSAQAPDAELRRWLARSGRARIAPAARIWSASVAADDARGRPDHDPGSDAPSPSDERSRSTREALALLVRRLRRLARSGAPLGVDELELDGRDLISMGYSPGPHFGGVLEALLERVLDDPGANDREILAAEAERWLAERGFGG